MTETIAVPPTTPTPQSTPAPASEAPLREAAIAKHFGPKVEPKAKPDLKPAPANATVEAAQEEPGLKMPPEEKAKPAPTEKPAETPPPEKGAKPTPWQLVHRYEGEVKTLKTQLADLEQKTKADPLEHPQVKERLAELDAIKAKHKALEDDLKFARYERSQDYKDKYETPYVNAFNAGRNKIASLKVVARENETTGEVQQPARQATAADFDALMALQDDGAAAEFADEKFGSRASLAIYHRERVNELREKALEAVDDYRKNGAAHEKEKVDASAAAQKQLSGQLSELWTKHFESVASEHPDLFKPVDGDDKGNADLKLGYDRAVQAFKKLNAADPNMTPEEREALVKLHAETMHYAAASRRLIGWHQRDTARIKELEKQLKDFQASEPAGGDGARKKLEVPLTGEQRFVRTLNKARH